MNFDGFVKDIETNHWNVFGVEVYKDGQLIHRYGDCTRNRYPIYSATKTIVAIAAGMAVDEGKLNLHKSILEYLPESVVKKLSKEQKESYTHITTHRLLTMSVCGYPFRPDGDNWLENVLTYEIPEPEKKNLIIVTYLRIWSEWLLLVRLAKICMNILNVNYLHL